MKTKFLSIIAATLLLASCAREMSSNVYTEGSSGGVAVEGVVVSARSITIKAQDKLEQNGAGIIGGGVAGGVAGNTIGKGKGNAVATVGGALAGAALGALLQDQLGTSDGMEYIVKVNQNQVGQTNQTQKKDISVNSGSKYSKQDIETDLKSQLITVVQGKDQIMQPGQRVYVIYSDDRPRIVPAQY